jgi:hypothetical protein
MHFGGLGNESIDMGNRILGLKGRMVLLARFEAGRNMNNVEMTVDGEL